MEAQASNNRDDAREEPSRMLIIRPRTLSLVGLTIFAAFLLLAIYIFVLTQLLPPQDAWLSSIFPSRGHYGEDLAVANISYIELLEASGLLSFFGLFVYSFERNWAQSFGRHALFALSLPLRVFGTMIAAIVYTETHLLWGELWYNVKFSAVYPQGFPWGNERVSSNLCFLHGSDYIPSYGSYCWFLNYDELLFIALGMFLVGWLISRSNSIRGDNASASLSSPEKTVVQANLSKDQNFGR